MPPRTPRRTFTNDIPPATVDDHRARLEAMRDQLTEQMAAASPAYVAGIARQLQAVLGELASLPEATPTESVVEQIRARRATRSGAAITSSPRRHHPGVVPFADS